MIEENVRPPHRVDLLELPDYVAQRRANPYEEDSISNGLYLDEGRGHEFSTTTAIRTATTPRGGPRGERLSGDDVLEQESDFQDVQAAAVIEVPAPVRDRGRGTSTGTRGRGGTTSTQMVSSSITRVERGEHLV